MLAMLMLMLIILMLILLNLNTVYADTDDNFCIRIMSLCCISVVGLGGVGTETPKTTTP